MISGINLGHLGARFEHFKVQKSLQGVLYPLKKKYIYFGGGIWRQRIRADGPGRTTAENLVIERPAPSPISYLPVGIPNTCNMSICSPHLFNCKADYRGPNHHLFCLAPPILIFAFTPIPPYSSFPTYPSKMTSIQFF
jgi:hypothetical protein